MTIRSSHSARLLAVALLVLATAPAAGQEPDDAALATAATRIQALVAPQAEAGLLSGVLLVARGDQVVFERAYGFASWELEVPSSPATRFGVASLTKPMTEIVVLGLAAAGRLDLDAPVARYLSGFPSGPGGGVPTVRHLLDHRAGVPHRVTGPIDETQPLGPEDVVERVRSRGLLFEPGSRRLYSSAGYTCLARVVEVVETKPFEQVLVERVFRPAGMAGAVSETGQTLMPRRAMPHRLGAEGGRVAVKRAPYKDLRFLTGAGSVYATAEDLWRLARAVRRGVFGDELAGDAYGGDLDAWRGWLGRTNGYEASIDLLPSADLAFVFLSNLQSAANWQVREQVQAVLLGREPAAIPLPPPVAEPFEPPESLVGTYGPAEITFVDGALFRGDNEIYPTEGGRYYIPASGSFVRFRRDPAGAVDALISVSGSGEETVLPRS